jgi:hypothetical protein
MARIPAATARDFLMTLPLNKSEPDRPSVTVDPLDAIVRIVVIVVDAVTEVRTCHQPIPATCS